MLGARHHVRSIWLIIWFLLGTIWLNTCNQNTATFSGKIIRLALAKNDHFLKPKKKNIRYVISKAGNSPLTVTSMAGPLLTKSPAVQTDHIDRLCSLLVERALAALPSSSDPRVWVERGRWGESCVRVLCGSVGVQVRHKRGGPVGVGCVSEVVGLVTMLFAKAKSDARTKWPQCAASSECRLCCL